MSEQTCGDVRELIPDFVGSRLADVDRTLVERHVAGCDDCRAELELATVVFANRPAAPEGLLERLLLAVETTRRQPTRTWWSVSAAAVAALALGIGLSSHPAQPVPVDVPSYAYEVEEGEIWVSDDGLVAGAPSFDELSDDALLELLDELSVESAGGSA
jgi:hypothetical protein